MTRMAFAVLAVVIAFTFSGRPARQAPFELRIESLSRLPVEVHVTAMSPARRGPAIVALDTLVPPWATVPIADSIMSIHVVVDGFGAVRATLTSAAGDTVVAHGRDITLARAPDGRFVRAWKVQPLVP